MKSLRTQWGSQKRKIDEAAPRSGAGADRKSVKVWKLSFLKSTVTPINNVTSTIAPIENEKNNDDKMDEIDDDISTPSLTTNAFALPKPINKTVTAKKGKKKTSLGDDLLMQI